MGTAMTPTLPAAYRYPSRAWRWRWLRRPSVLAVATTLVAAAVAAVVGVLPVQAATDDCRDGAVGCAPRMALGLSTTGLPRTTGELEALEASLGRTADVALTFTSFRYAFDGPRLRALALAGRMPMITWEPFDPTAPDQDRYPLADIAAGTSDAYLRAQATRIREVGRPVAVRFAHEMNASWYPWGAGVNGNTPADYVAAYRHVHDLFAAEGVRNVTWVWSPAVVDTPDAPDLAAFYPGDSYVDWVGLSAYLDEPTDTWASSVAPTVRELAAVAPHAPLYLAETGVLPGPTRAAMIDDLLDNLLRTPNAIGFTWFEVDSREDWRIGADAAALDAVRAALASGWYSDGATTPWPAPVLLQAPVVTGAPQVGAVLSATTGTWRGATTTAGRWLTCTDASEASCTELTPTGTTAGTTTGTTAGTATGTTPGTTATWTTALDTAARGHLLRLQVTATGPGGSTTAVSAPVGPVLQTPAEPARPVVEAHPGALRVVLPPAPAGATHWQLRIGATTVHPFAVGTVDRWLTGLTTGTTHDLSLAALAVAGEPGSPTGTVLVSPPTAGRVVPMAPPSTPYVSTTGPSATLTLPRAPAGAQGWLLTLDGVEQRPALTAATVTLPALTTGVTHRWTLAATAETWAGQGVGSTTVAVSGSVVPLATPDLPVVTAGPGQATLTFPAPPPGASAWRVSVGPTTYPDLAVGTPSFSVTGLYPGYPSTWTLRAVNPTARSLPVTGKVAALPLG